MKEIRIFENEKFGQVRTAWTGENPLFCAADVCRALGYTNGRKAVADHCDERDVTKRDTPTSSGIQSMTYVNESGMYALIFGSKLESAREFKYWVTSEVLPSIRKAGGYIATTPEMTDEEIMARAVLIGQETIKRQKERIASLEAENRQQALKIEQDAPKVVFADAVQVSKDNILIRLLVKFMQQNGVKIGELQLFEWMHKNGYLCRVGKNNHVPTRKSMDLGVMVQKENAVVTGTTTFTSITPLVTPKGQIYFINKFLCKEPVLFTEDVVSAAVC